jgi:hypothetical protein
MRLLLVTPPMTQLNTPYPATAYLRGFLLQHAARLDLEVAQADPAIELFCALFSRAGLTALGERLAARFGGGGGKKARRGNALDPSVAHFLAERERYVATVDAAVRFLQGRDPSLALRIAGREWLPEGPRFAAIDDAMAAEPGADPLAWAFGELGLHDRAKYLASLYVDDLADVIARGEDPHFGLSRYGEKLAASAPTSTAWPRRWRRRRRWSTNSSPRSPGGCSTRIARRAGPDRAVPRQRLRRAADGPDRARAAPATRIAIGGGYVNTELRGLREPRLFDLVDYVTLDDGEAPLLALLEHLRDPTRPLLRTFVRDDGAVACAPPTSTTCRRADRHADLRRPAARSLPVGGRDAQPDAPAVVRRPVEQADRGPRLLLEEVQLLRRHARLHRPLRPVAADLLSIASRR